MATTVVWFWDDLRVHDNPALWEAARRGRVVPVFIYAPEELGERAWGGARRWWLHYSLQSLHESLRQRGSALSLYRAPESLPVLEKVLTATHAEALYWNTRYDPIGRTLQERAARIFKARGIEVRAFPSRLMHDPDTLRTDSGQPYTVFTPFWKRFLQTVQVPSPLPAPERLIPPESPPPEGVSLESLALLPVPDWAGGIRATWQPGETAAHQRLHAFLQQAIHAYAEMRDRPDVDGTSRLSPYLASGEISPRQIWHATLKVADDPWSKGVESFLRELGWREFAYHVLYHHPHTLTEPLRPEFRNFPWQDAITPEVRAWHKGRTGIPMVDAGMRQLWHTGWMHNRVRMIVASWLTKNLLYHWRLGEAWFWDTLVDADPANNLLGWQWTAGCGADAAPYYRIFNPVLQGRKFDPHGDYVRQWVPELRNLPTEHLHAPWEAPASVLETAGVALGKTYPLPQVELNKSRKRALEIFENRHPKG